jgi:hypothetical protein
MTITVPHEYTTTGAGTGTLPSSATWVGASIGDIAIITIEATIGQFITGVSYLDDGSRARYDHLGFVDGGSGSAPRVQAFGKKLRAEDFSGGFFRRVTLDGHANIGKKQLTILHSSLFPFSSHPDEYCPVSHREPYNGNAVGSPYEIYNESDTSREMCVFAPVSFGAGSTGANLQTRWGGIGAFAAPYWDEADTTTNPHQCDRKLFQVSDTLSKLEFQNQHASNKAVFIFMIQTHVGIDRFLEGKSTTVARGKGQLRKGNFTGYGNTVSKGKGKARADHFLRGKSSTVATGFGRMKVTRRPKGGKSITVARGKGQLRKISPDGTFDLTLGMTLD